MNMFDFALDGFRIMHVAMSLVLFILAWFFSRDYFSGVGIKPDGKFKFFYGLTLVAILGIFTSDDLFTLFVCFEVMSIASYGLLIPNDENANYDTSKFYLFVSIITGMFMLMGMFFIYAELRTLDYVEMATLSATANKTNLYLGGALMMVGFGTKSAMYPLHFWLCRTYFDSHAPVTSLFSAVLSKAGVFGIVILSVTVFSGDSLWGEVLVVFALLTMIWGGICALIQNDMKKIIAFSSMSQVGFIIFAIAMNNILTHYNAVAINGISLHILNHSLFKLGLFTICGIIAMKIGSTKLTDIKGFGRRNKLVALAFVICAFGLMGVPLFSGYISKTLIHESVVEQYHLTHEFIYEIYEYLFYLGGAFTNAYMLKIAYYLFSKNGEKGSKFFARKTDENYVKLPFSAKFILSMCVVLTVCAGLLPNIIMDGVASFSSDFMLGDGENYAMHYFEFAHIKDAFISIFLGVFIFAVTFAVRKHSVKVAERKMLEFEKVHKNIFGIIIPKICIVFFTVVNAISEYIIANIYPVLKKIITPIIGLFSFKFMFEFIRIIALILGNFVDVLIDFSVIHFFKPNKEKDPTSRVTISYQLGERVDILLDILRIKHKNKMADVFSDFEAHSAVRRRMISASLSYGLFFAGIGFIGLLVYMMIIR